MSSRQIMGLRPYEPPLYESLDLNRLAVFVLALFKERGWPASLENLTVALFRLFPTKFSLASYAEYPDSSRVQRALLQLRPKYRNWALGDHRTGYVLTDQGEEVLAEVENVLSGKAVAPGPPRGEQHQLYAEREVGLLEQCELLQAYREGQSQPASRFFFDALGAFSYTPKAVLRRRLDRLEHMAEDIGRSDLVDFLKWARRTYRNLIVG